MPHVSVSARAKARISAEAKRRGITQALLVAQALASLFDRTDEARRRAEQAENLLEVDHEP